MPQQTEDVRAEKVNVAEGVGRARSVALDVQLAAMEGSSVLGEDDAKESSHDAGEEWAEWTEKTRGFAHDDGEGAHSTLVDGGKAQSDR